MTTIQIHTLKGTPERVADREDALVTAMQALGYSKRTLFRSADDQKLEAVSGESVGVAGGDWQPPVNADDICVVISFKKQD